MPEALSWWVIGATDLMSLASALYVCRSVLVMARTVITEEGIWQPRLLSGYAFVRAGA